MRGFEALENIDVSSCHSDDGPNGGGRARVGFSLDGKVAFVDLQPPFAGTRVGACVIRKLSAARIDPFGPGDLPQVPTSFRVP
jgi:hypothetical protein